jgi:2-amino-4-hydroxy-6-hydroxymethyldihydropteridine diphosphokinase
MSSAFLLLGSNLGDRLNNLQEARILISRELGKIITTSSIYQTQAWGNIAQPDFYNQVVEISPFHEPIETLKLLLKVENLMGRVRAEKRGNRLIDIDILLCHTIEIKTPELTIPHPYLHVRRFTLIPLVEIAPSAVHPVLQKTMQQLLDECPDPLAVSKVQL